MMEHVTQCNTVVDRCVFNSSLLWMQQLFRDSTGGGTTALVQTETSQRLLYDYHFPLIFIVPRGWILRTLVDLLAFHVVPSLNYFILFYFIFFLRKVSQIMKLIIKQFKGVQMTWKLWRRYCQNTTCNLSKYVTVQITQHQRIRYADRNPNTACQNISIIK